MTDILVPRSLVKETADFGGTLQNDCLLGQAVIRDGALVGLKPPRQNARNLIVPKWIEPHCHLDKCHTIHRLGQAGGDLHAAIARQYADKQHWDEDDIRTRATRGLNEATANGCAHIRSHVDWGHAIAPPLSWSVLVELAEEHPGLQLAALTSVQHWAHPEFSETVGNILALTNGVAGAFVHGQADLQDGLRAMFKSAQSHDLMLDFHVDEGLGDLNGLEMIADIALETGFDRPILCGHCVSLVDKSTSGFQRIADKVLRAGITVCALPVTNLYLQGRTVGTPDRRGITRIKELRRAGVPVVIGSDNVADAFCPLGAHDPLAALSLASLAAHLDPPFGDWLPSITTNAARALGIEPTYVDGAALTDLMSCKTAHTADLISGRTNLCGARQVLA